MMMQRSPVMKSANDSFWIVIGVDNSNITDLVIVNFESAPN